MNKLLFGNEGREAVVRGVNKTVDAVKVTLGGKGRTVIIQVHPGLTPQFTKDGVTVVQSITLPDNVENIGALMIRDVARKTVEQSGDGTTTASILTGDLITRGMAVITPEINVQEFKEGMDAACAEVVKYIRNSAQKIENIEQLRKIATVSANNDSEIGNLIADAADRVGKDGFISVEESKSNKTTVDVADGMRINSGWMSHHFISDPGRQRAVLENPVIVVTDTTPNTLKDIHNLLSIAFPENGASRPVFVICRDMDGAALGIMTMNNNKPGSQFCVVRPPDTGKYERPALEDIALYVGADFISTEKGNLLAELQPDQVGGAERIIVDNKSCTIIGGKGNFSRIKLRVAELQQQLESDADMSEFDRNKLKERVARLSGSVGVIRVGGNSAIEIKEKKDRVDDALHATWAAMEEGYVSGGGVCLRDANYSISPVGSGSRSSELGALVVCQALNAPINQIKSNAGVSEKHQWWKWNRKPEVVLGNGYNTKTGNYENMIAAGIIDPAKVVRVSLENAVSVAGVFLTTECIIAVEQGTKP